MASNLWQVHRLSFAIRASMITVVGATMNFTMYSDPVRLRYGEVYNTIQFDDSSPHTKFPQDVVARYAAGDKDMVITGFDMDMVRRHADGSETQVKLSDHYLHHYILYFGETKALRQLLNASNQDKHLQHALTGCHGMQGKGLRMFQDLVDPGRKLNFVAFGSAAGAEYRHNPQRFKSPYGLVLRRPESWAPTLHIINTNLGDNSSNSGAPEVSPLLECPCSPQRKIDVASGTIDGHKPEPAFGCSREFAATGNPSCSLSTYQGGWRCCEHGMFVIDTAKECATPSCAEQPVDEVFLRVTFTYEDARPETRAIEVSACCDVTGVSQGFENIEYDIPQCPAGTPPSACIHVAESVQPIGFHGNRSSQGYEAEDMVDLVFAQPHLHVGGLSMELIDDVTGETLCEVHRTDDGAGGVAYGTGTEPGNENGYLVGLATCSWNGKSAPRFRRDHPMRSRAVYNASVGQTGVMGLWLMDVSAVSDPDIVV